MLSRFAIRNPYLIVVGCLIILVVIDGSRDDDRHRRLKQHLDLELAHRLRADGIPVTEAVVTASRLRLRPILMSSLATFMGLLPMALELGTGSETYGSLARTILGGLLASVILTLFVVPAAYNLFYRKLTMRGCLPSGEIAD